MLRGTVLCAVIALVAACGGGSAGGETPAAATGSLATPNPLAVTVAVDGSKTASASIGPAGGTVSATTAAGVTVTLAIPAGALLSMHPITLTPIASVTGMPLGGGLVAGAQLGPDGLLLAKAATLSLTGLKAAPAGMKEYGFGYHGSGREFHLVPAKAGGGSVSLQLWHFSGAGVGAGTSADASSLAAKHAPTAPQDQVEQATAAGQQAITLLTAWEATLSSQLSGQVDLSLLDVVYQQTMVFGEIAAAAGRPDLAHLVYSKLGLVLQTAATLALSRCRTVPDASEALRVIRWIEWAQLHPSTLPHLATSELESGVVACLRFRLDFSTKVDTSFGPEAVDLSVESKDIPVNALTAVPLKFAPGTGDIKYTAFKWVVPAGIPYTFTASTVRPFTVTDVSMNLDAFDVLGAAGLVEDMSITVDFGDTTETITVQAPFPITLPLKSFYANGMQNSHRDAAVGVNLYRIAPWTLGSGAVWAEAKQGCPCPSPSPVLTYTQDTLFQLRHTPQ